MGRPSLGSGAKSRVVCVRLSQADHDALAARWGSAGKALGALVAEGLTEQPDRKRLAGRTVTKEDIADAMDVPVDVVKVHRHRRGEVIRVDYDFGTPKKIYACQDCGEELA